MSAGQTQPHHRSIATPVWSNRILIAAIAGILVLTLFPFRIDFHRRIPVRRSHFLLGRGARIPNRQSDFLNVLLFVPFGFGLAEKLRERGVPRPSAFLIVFASGAVFSYTIEYLQLFIPTRDSGWEDVITNSSGSAVGFLLFEAIRKPALDLLSGAEEVLRGWLVPSRVVPILLMYFASGVGMFAHWQERANLSGWLPDANLVVENANPENPFVTSAGHVQQLQLWDRPIRDTKAISAGLSHSEFSAANKIPGLLASYEFSGAPPFKDQEGALPRLSWITEPAGESDSKSGIQESVFLVSTAPVSELAKQLAATNQFSLRLVYVPSDIGRYNTRIVSIATKSGQVNLSLYQAGPTLVFWFRTPLTANRPTLSLRTTRILRVNEPNDILFSYDGSSLQAYVDGVKAAPGYVLGPGDVLVERFYRPNPIDLVAVQVLGYGAMFLPVGLLAGLGIRSLSCNAKRTGLYLLIVVLAATALQLAYSTISQSPFSVGGILVSIMFAAGGALWIYADHTTNSRVC